MSQTKFGPDYSTWDVAYEVTREGYEPAMTNVILGPDAGGGRATTVHDIPQIIAIRRGVRSDEIKVIARTRTSPLLTHEQIADRLRVAYDSIEHRLNHEESDRQTLLEELLATIEQLDVEISNPRQVIVR